MRAAKMLGLTGVDARSVHGSWLVLAEEPEKATAGMLSATAREAAPLL